VNAPVTDDSALNETPAGLNGFETEVVAVFADLVGMLGLPKSMGEIYGLLFAAAEPLGFADIERRLNLSKGSVSQGLKALRELGAIREAESRDEAVDAKRAGENSRLTRWTATTELRQLIGNLLRERLTPYLARQDQRMATAKRALAQEKGKLSARDLKTLGVRLKKLETWQARAGMVLPVIGKML
jgi:HTH-type transcriptional regulator, glycine betaine synthesis regulator